MTPEKLFDYLEGKLPPREKEQLERALIASPELQRELATARQIHRELGRAPNEEASSSGDQRGARLGRQVATACAVLVALNVGIGLYFIFRKGGPPEAYRRERQNLLRQPVQRAVEQAANAIFTPPTIGPEQIVLASTPDNQEAIATAVITAAEKAGGSGTKALPNEQGLRVLVDVPAARAAEFRAALASLGGPSSTPTMERAPPVAPNDIVRFEVLISARR